MSRARSRPDRDGGASGGRSACASPERSRGFFLLPAIGFAAWSFARLAEEVQRSRDLLITQTLRDAVLSAGGFFQGDDAEAGEQLAS